MYIFCWIGVQSANLAGCWVLFRNRCTRVKSILTKCTPTQLQAYQQQLHKFWHTWLGFWRVGFSERLQERSPHNPMPRAPRLLSAFPSFLYLYHPPTPPSSYYNLNVITRKTYLYWKFSSILNQSHSIVHFNFLILYCVNDLEYISTHETKWTK